MPEYAVIYDPALEIAAIIDTDNGQAVGPICPGVNGQAQLEAFLNNTPPAFVDNSTATTLTEAFRQFWAKNYGPTATAQPPVTPAVESAPSSGGDASAALAEHEAANTSETPAPAPADADVEADKGEATAVTPIPLASDPSGVASTQGTAPVVSGNVTPAPKTSAPDTTVLNPTVGPCPFCNGSGTIRTLDDKPDETCNACRGTGKLPPPVAA